MLIEKEQVLETFDGFPVDQIHNAVGEEPFSFVHLVNY